MAVVLLLLLLSIFSRRQGYVAAALLAQLVTMTVPQVYRPVAVVWFGLSHVMGVVASRVILTLVFFVVVTPIAVWRRSAGNDSLSLGMFRKGRTSVMKARNHTYVGKDLEHPY
jgi:hypothetical protein